MSAGDQARVLIVQRDAQAKGDLLIWAVYDHPKDYPDHWVARPHSLYHGALQVSVSAHTLKGVRELLPPGLVRLERSAGDEAKIVEVWL